MEILWILLTLLLVTRVFGEVAYRLGQPSLVGEIIAGIALGAAVAAFAEHVPFLQDLKDDRTFLAFTNLGIFFLMLFAGIELRAGELAEVSGKSFIVAAGGLLLPLAAGILIGWTFLPESALKPAQCLFLGTALAITAVPVSIRVLMDLGRLHSLAGRMIVSAAIIDDLLSLLLLAFLTGFLNEGGFPDAAGILALAGRIALFFAVTVGVGRFVVPRIGRVITSLRTAEVKFGSLVLAGLAFAILADALGLHFILGAFAAGLLFRRRFAGMETYNEIRKRVSAVTFGFLAPLFFASIGLHLDLSAVTGIPVFLLILIGVAFLTKLIGAGVPALLLGFSRRDSLAIGVGMSARGAVELIIAQIALSAGLFSLPDPAPPVIEHLFSAIVIVAVVTTVATPFALRTLFARMPGRNIPEITNTPQTDTDTP